MEIQVRLLVQEHHNGFFSLEVVGDAAVQAKQAKRREHHEMSVRFASIFGGKEPKKPDAGLLPLRVYAPDLEQAREDLFLVLSDRIERTHPRLQHQFSPPAHQELHVFTIPDAIKVESSEGESAVETDVSVLVTRDRRWQRLWFPRWNCHYWVSVEEELEEAVKAFLQRDVFSKMRNTERLKDRLERKMWMEELVIEAELPAPEEFTGKHLKKDLLPHPAEEKDKKKKQKEEEEEDPERKGIKGKKRRPKTPKLKSIGVHLSQMAREKELEPAFGRDKEVEELLNLIQYSKGIAVAVVGASGVGKTTILNQLIYHLQSPLQLEKLRYRPVFFVDASRLVATDGHFGDWQQQCLDVIQESIDAEVILYLGDLLALLDAGKHIGSDQNVSFLLRPYLAGKRLTVIGECNPRAWAQLELRDVGFARLFTPYRVEEPEPSVRDAILREVSASLAKDYEITIEPTCLSAVQELSRRYSSEGSPLGQAIYFLRRLVDDANSRELDTLTRKEAIEQFCSESGLPAFLVRDDMPLEPDAVLQHFQARLIGQEEAVHRMTDLVAMIKAGLSDLDRPLGSFLFVGPTGVGKTEMAKTLASFLFGSAKRLVRFDMSEFVHAGSVHRFLGDKHNEGKLVSAIRRSPFAVILFDEIEKAHPAVFDVLLQVLGEARLSDEAGRVADFRNAVILMTSNLGVDTLRRRVGFGDTDAAGYREHFIAEAEQFFRPEFFNRLDAIIPFMPLEHEAIVLITEREVAKYLQREGVRQRELELEISETARAWLAEHGVEPRYGARPLKRVIETQMNAPLARTLSQRNQSQAKRIVVRPETEIRAEADATSTQVQDDAVPDVAASHATVTVDDGGPDALGFSFIAPSGKRKEAGQARTQLYKLLERIALVRFVAQRWAGTSTFRELRQEVRLFDRLSQDKNFWNDRESAEKRMAKVKIGRALIESFEQFQSQLHSLEDLAYEAYHERNLEPLSMLKLELGEGETQLAEMEMRLFAERLKSPHTCVLYFGETESTKRFRRELIERYLRVALSKGWNVYAYAVKKYTPTQLREQGFDPEPLLETLSSRSKSKPAVEERVTKDEAGNEKVQRVSAKKKKKVVAGATKQRWESLVAELHWRSNKRPSRLKPGDPEHQVWYWSEATGLKASEIPTVSDPEAIKRAKESGDEKGIFTATKVSQIVQTKIESVWTSLLGLTEKDAPMALVFQGEFVSCWLQGESGLHDDINNESTEAVRVLFGDQNAQGPGGLSRPLDLEAAWKPRRLRTVSRRQKLLLDHRLDAQLSLARQWEQGYEQFMRMALYFDTFDQAGMKWLRALGQG